VLLEDYPAPLEQIVMRALHKDRQERFQSITALLEALETAFPEAFGPRPDEAAALWLQRLMNERILERKATLRMAEELAEKSHGSYSLPVVTVSSVPLAKSPRAALGLVLVASVAAAALAGTHYLQGLRPVAVHSALALTPSALSSVATAVHNAPPVQEGAGATAIGDSARAPLIIALPAAVITSSTLRPKRAHSARTAREEQREFAAETSSAAPFATSAAPELRAELKTEPEAAPSPPNTPEPGPPSPPQALAPALAPPQAVNHAAIAPKLVSSKLGQNQLLSNPASGASRVRLPAGFNRMGETFSAVVNICVSATGNVSSVNILRSAGPALDAQIPSALSRWHYRPLLEAGRPTPFCYKLNYEIDAL